MLSTLRLARQLRAVRGACVDAAASAGDDAVPLLEALARVAAVAQHASTAGNDLAFRQPTLYLGAALRPLLTSKAAGAAAARSALAALLPTHRLLNAAVHGWPAFCDAAAALAREDARPWAGDRGVRALDAMARWGTVAACAAAPNGAAIAALATKLGLPSGWLRDTHAVATALGLRELRAELAAAVAATVDLASPERRAFPFSLVPREVLKDAAALAAARGEPIDMGDLMLAEDEDEALPAPCLEGLVPLTGADGTGAAENLVVAAGLVCSSAAAVWSEQLRMEGAARGVGGKDRSRPGRDGSVGGSATKRGRGFRVDDN